MALTSLTVRRICISYIFESMNMPNICTSYSMDFGWIYNVWGTKLSLHPGVMFHISFRSKTDILVTYEDKYFGKTNLWPSKVSMWPKPETATWSRHYVRDLVTTPELANIWPIWRFRQNLTFQSYSLPRVCLRVIWCTRHSTKQGVICTNWKSKKWETYRQMWKVLEANHS